MYFPSNYGFRVGRYSESDGARQKTFVVRKDNSVILVVTWDPPHNHNFELEESNWHSRFNHTHASCNYIHFIGLAVATIPQIRPNWAFDLTETEGIDMIVMCFGRVWGICRSWWDQASGIPLIKEALDFLAEPPKKKRRGPNANQKKHRPYTSEWRVVQRLTVWPRSGIPVQSTDSDAIQRTYVCPFVCTS